MTTLKQSLKQRKPEDFLNLLTLFHQFYNINGHLPTAAKVKEEYGVPESLTEAALKDKEFLSALEERGIIVRPEDSEWASKILTPQQLIVANHLLDLTDQRSNKKKLQEDGISTQVYNTWLKDPAFQGYLRERAKQLLGENDHEVNLAFLDKIRQGDFKSIEFYYEMTGQFTRQRAVSPANTGADTNRIIMSIIEIIDEEVTDAPTMLRISERIKSLINAQAVANALTNGAVAAPVGEVVSAEAATPTVVSLRKVEL